MCLCTSWVGGIVWDSGCDLLPTKTSRMLVLLFGRYPSSDGTCSQVFTMWLVNPFRCFILEAIILSFASLILLRAQSPLEWIFGHGFLLDHSPTAQDPYQEGRLREEEAEEAGSPAYTWDVVGFGLSRWLDG